MKMGVATLVICIVLLAGGGPVRTIDQKEIKSVVEQFVRTKLSKESAGRYALEFRSVPDEVGHIPADAVLRIIDNGTIDLRNNVMIPVEVFLKDHVEHTFVVSVRVRRFGKVLLASETIQRKQDAVSGAVEEQTIETTTAPEDVVVTRSELDGKRAKRMILRGTILTESMFEPIPVVNQGSPVTLVVRENNVLIKAAAIARDDGGAGDIVVVQKRGSGDRFKARVIDERTVEMIGQN